MMRRLGHHEPKEGPGRVSAAGTPVPTPTDSGTVGRGGADGSFPAPPLALTVDWKLFEHHLADEDLTDQEKREFIEALWYIVVSFVDLGFGIEPVNQALRAAALEHPQPAKPVAETKTDSSAGDQAATISTTTTKDAEESDRKERTK